ncbi:MAG: hypothetical protein AB1405_03735 [Bdellovibrionota bacterium]
MKGRCGMCACKVRRYKRAGGYCHYALHVQKDGAVLLEFACVKTGGRKAPGAKGGRRVRP